MHNQWPLNSKWTYGKDGLPEHPDADPKCDLCNGHGIVDSGNGFGCILENCECVKNNKEK